MRTVAAGQNGMHPASTKQISHTKVHVCVTDMQKMYNMPLPGYRMLITIGMRVDGDGACRVDAGKVELDGAQYLGFRIPLTISQLVWIEAILVGGAEIYRNRERDPETRLYPGDLSTATLILHQTSGYASGQCVACCCHLAWHGS